MKTTLHILMVLLLLVLAYFVYAYFAGYYQSVVPLIGVTLGTIILLGVLASYYVRRCGSSGLLGHVDKMYRRLGLAFKTGG